MSEQDTHSEDHTSVEVPLLSRGEQQEDGWEDEGEVEARLEGKLHGRMRPFTVLRVLASIMCYTSLPAAALFGLLDALHLRAVQFSTVVAAYYIGQAVSLLLLEPIQRLARTWSSIGTMCAVVLGVVSFVTGFTTNFAQIFLARFVLGFVHSVLSVCMGELGRLWYKPKSPQISAFGSPFVIAAGLVESAALMAVVSSATLSVGWHVEVWRYLFYVNGIQIIPVALYAFYWNPGSPGTAAWLSEPEGRIVAKWTAERSKLEEQHNSRAAVVVGSDSDNNRWYAAILPYLKVLYLGFFQIAVAVPKSFGRFWPLVFVAVSGIEEPSPWVLLLCSFPWILPACLNAMFARNWKNLLRQPYMKFFHLINATFLLPSITAATGFYLGSFGKPKPILICSLYIVPITFVNEIPWEIMLRCGTVGVTDFMAPWKRKYVIRFLSMCSILGKILGCYVWMAQAGKADYEGGFISSANATGIGMVGFAFCSGEAVASIKRDADRRQSEEAQTSEREMEMRSDHDVLV